MEYIPANKMSIAWQLPQYALVTAGEVMFSVTGLEFSYSQVGFCKWKVEVELLLRGWSFNPDIASLGASLVAQMVKNLPIMQQAQVQSLGWEDPLEKGLATHSSILAWRIPWTEEPGRIQSLGSQRVGHN